MLNRMVDTMTHRVRAITAAGGGGGGLPKIKAALDSGDLFFT